MKHSLPFKILLVAAMLFSTMAKADQLNGSYTIDPGSPASSTNFQDFASAITYMTSTDPRPDGGEANTGVVGVSGPVVFQVATGTYSITDAISIPEIPGASVDNTITFDGGDATTTIVTGEIWGAALVFNECKYVTVKNLTIENTNTSDGGGVVFYNNQEPSLDTDPAPPGSCNTITGCIVNVNYNRGAVCIGIVSDQSGTSAWSNCYADSILVDNNICNGGMTGIAMEGTWPNNFVYNRGIVITRNTINNVNDAGVALETVLNETHIEHNKVTNSGIGIRVYAYYWNTTPNMRPYKIIGNTCVDNDQGIYCDGISGTATNPSQIYNNICIGSPSNRNYQSVTIYTDWGGSAYTEIIHNTFVKTGSENGWPDATALYYGGSGTNLIIKNNDLANFSGGNASAMYLDLNSIPANAVNYNNYYSTSSNLMAKNGTTYSSTTYNTSSAGGDTSYNEEPAFMNLATYNAHLSDACGPKGIYFASVPVDIDGDTRSLTAPMIGADEAIGQPNDMSVKKILSPTVPITMGLQDMSVLVKNVGTNTLSNFDVSYIQNNGAPVTINWTGTLPPCGETTVTFTGANQINLGAANNIVVFTSSPNSSADANMGNDSARTLLYAPLSGNYVIGHSLTADFHSFADAMTALQSGIAGAVNFTVEPGDYQESVKLNPPVGISATNTLTFDGGSAATTSITSNDMVAFTINQCSYVTLKNLTITNTNGSFVIAIVGNVSNNNGSNTTIKNCVINCFGDSYGYGVSISGSATSPWNSCRIDSTLIDSSQINGGGTGIQLSGDMYSNGTYNIYNRFTHNEINNGTQTGIQITAGGGTEINYNNVVMDPNSSYTTGISLNSGSYMSVGSMYFYKGPKTPNSASNNYIVASNTGLNVNNPGGTTNKPSMFCNNMIYVDGPSPYTAMNIYAYQYFLNSGDPTPTCRIYHNTVNLNTSSTWAQSAFYYNYNSYSNPGANDLKADIKNNIFAVTSGGASTVPAFVYVYSPGGVAPNPTMDYNIYYNKTGGNLLYLGGAFYNNSNYNLASTGGANSINVAPPFVNSANMHISNACYRGVDLTAWVPTDIDGDARSTTPNIGADEYPGLSLDVSVEAVTAPVFPIQAGTNDLSVRVRNNGYSILNSFSLTYTLNSEPPVTQVWTGTFNPCDTLIVTFTGAQQITIPAGSNSLVVFSSNPNAAADMNPGNDLINVSLSTPMSGDYVIGDQPADDYPNFTQAVDDMEVRGVDGHIRFHVRAGDYYENVYMESIIGTSDSSTVTFSSMDSDPTSVNVQASSDYVVTMKNISYTTFENITFTQTSNNWDMGSIKCIGTLNNNTFTKCKFIVPYYNGYLLNSNSDNYNFRLTHNDFKGSGNGIYHQSTTTGQASDLSTLIIDSNTFVGCSNGINMNYTKDSKIRGNYYNMNDYSYSGGVYAYMAQSINTAFEITDNVFEANNNSNYVNFSWAFDECNYYVTSVPSADLFAKIANNTINMVDATNYFYGYSYCYDGRYINYYNNNITIPDNGGNSAFYVSWYYIRYFNAYNNTFPIGNTNFNYYAGGYPGNRFVNNTLTNSYSYPWGSAISMAGLGNDMVFKNNIIAFAGSSNAFYASVPATADWDYNLYYNYYNNGLINGYSDMPSWKANSNGKDVNSLSYDPGLFNMYSNLSPDPNNQASWSLNGRGMPDGTINTDITGASRSAEVLTGASDLGAYEFTPNTVPPLADAYPTDPAVGTTQAFLFGQDTIATIVWDQFASVPGTLSVQLYSGTNPPAVLGGNMMNAYWDIQSAGSGNYNYVLNLYHKGNMVGNNPDKSALIGAQHTSSWNFIYTSTSDVDNNILTVNGLTSTGLFTGTDQNAPFTGLTPPIFFDLHAKNMGSDVAVNWNTEMNKDLINKGKYVVERSFDAKNFTAIGSVNITSENSYNYIDQGAVAKAPGTMIYYRLRTLANDGVELNNGSTEYSKVALVNLNDQSGVYPNPFSSSVSVNITMSKAGEVRMNVKDISGRVLVSQNKSASMGSTTVNVDQLGELKPGVYFLTVDADGTSQVYKIIKN